MTNIASYLTVDTILFLDATSRDEAIHLMIDSLAKYRDLEAKEEFTKAVFDREKLASTGIGMGVAIPHAKLKVYDDFFIAIGILKNGIAWNSLDQIDVRLIFLIGGPDDKQSQYLNLLSQLTLFLRDEEIRKKLLTLTKPQQIIELF